MRWRFIDPNNQVEVLERNAITAQIDAWWRAFQGTTQDLTALFSQEIEWDLPEWMDQHLQGIEPDLMWEFGPAVNGDGHRLVITPESAHHLRPLVQAILKRQPSIENWEFYEYRLAEDFESALQTVEARQGCDISDYMVRVSRGDEQTIDLTFTSPTITGLEDQAAFGAAFVAAESLLGEEILNNWIGAIQVDSLPHGKKSKSLSGQSSSKSSHLIGLDRLDETVQALIGSIRDQLPPTPHCEWDNEADWTLWELKPEEADDYIGQHDLFVGKSLNPSLWTAAHGGRLFCSERFSRCGEMFCYLKLDGSQGLGDDGFADKSEVEDALDEVLKPQQLGCHIGGGTGLRYSYIDLALTDVDRSIQVIRKRLQEGKVPNRSWILFYDNWLAAEWVGIYDDTPPPPMQLDE